MRQSVLDIFPLFTAALEGRVAWMYLDVKGLVTTGLGCLLADAPTAAALPWRHKSGELATAGEIRDEWQRVKSDKQLAQWGHRVAERFTSLRLDEASIDDLARTRLLANEAYCRKIWPKWDAFPADAQLATMSMCWALGAGFSWKWPLFRYSVARQNWLGAMKNCHIRETNNVGIVPRNRLNKAHFAAAASTATPEELTRVGTVA